MTPSLFISKNLRFEGLTATASAHYISEFEFSESVPIPVNHHRDNIDERGPYHGGDMILNDDQLAELKQGIVGTNYRWPGGKVPYVIDSTFTATELASVQLGITKVSNYTCVTLTPRSSESSYIYIKRGTDGTGCFSYVGMQPAHAQPQIVNIQGQYASSCANSGIVAHELIHALGFFHEQSRTDRDTYITVNYNNIPTGSQYNFDKFPPSQVTSYTPYDFDSIMHYSAYAFALNPSIPTLQPKSRGVTLSRLGQRNLPSTYDIQKINAMYKGLCS